MDNTTSSPSAPPAIQSGEYTARRNQLAGTLPPEGVALIPGGTLPAGTVLFRQDNEIQYLCGIEEPHIYLLIETDGTSTLYLPHRTRGEGLVGDPAAMTRISGIDRFEPLAALEQRMAQEQLVLLPLQGEEGAKISRDTFQAWERAVSNDPFDGRLSRNKQIRGQLQSRHSQLVLEDLSPLLDELRLIKSPAELAFMRKAGELTGLAALAAMRATRPGRFEYNLQAELEHTYLSGGARGAAYAPIIPGSSRAGDAHYLANNCRLDDGDIVLVDCAPDYHYYTSDIGRMWPVNGVFDEAQRSLYSFVLAYHKVVLSLIRPGALRAELHQQAADTMRPLFDKWEFPNIAVKDTAACLFEFPGHISHGVGMAVHDVSQHYDRPFAPGMVFAVDPMAWGHQHQMFYRVEDTVVVTEDGYENLTASCPIEIADIERTMASS